MKAYIIGYFPLGAEYRTKICVAAESADDALRQAANRLYYMFGIGSSMELFEERELRENEL